MANVVPSQKKQLGHSRLRHEVKADSTDDEQFLAGEQVQVPDGQVVVPETQFGDNVGMDSDALTEFGGMSPNSRALLERNSVSKAKEIVDASPVQFGIQRDKFIPGLRETSPGTGFTFGAAGPKKSKPNAPSRRTNASTSQRFAEKAPLTSTAGIPSPGQYARCMCNSSF